MISFSAFVERVNQPFKVVHISDEGIARCSKNIEPAIKENRKVLQKSIQYSNEARIGL